MHFYKLLFYTFITLAVAAPDCNAKDIESPELTAYLESEGINKSSVQIPNDVKIKSGNTTDTLHIDYVTYLKMPVFQKKHQSSLVIAHEFSIKSENNPIEIVKSYMYLSRIINGTLEWQELGDNIYLWKSEGLTPGYSNGEWYQSDGIRVAYIKRVNKNIRIVLGMFTNREPVDVERIMSNSRQIWLK